MKLELDRLVFIFKGHETPTMGKIPKQVVHPRKINMGSKTISARLEGERGKKLRNFKFDRFMVCSHDDIAAVLYGKRGGE